MQLVIQFKSSGNRDFRRAGQNDLTYKKQSIKTVRFMRRYKFISRRTLCLTAALLLSLSPVFHGLHLASCERKQLSCHTQPMEHVHCGYGSLSHNEHASKGSECCRAQLSGPQDAGSHSHNPSTCPFCRFFNQLMHGGWINPPKIIQFPEEIRIWMSCPNRVVLHVCSFSRGYPRAPPV